MMKIKTGANMLCTCYRSQYINMKTSM